MEPIRIVLVGVIVAAGLWIGGRVQGVLRDGLARAGMPRPEIGGLAGRWLIGAFAVAMALQQIGFGETIVVTAFALLFGALCLALALAFGRGARTSAGELVERALERARMESGNGRVGEAAGRGRREASRPQ